MSIDLLRALLVIAQFCLKSDGCEDCLLKGFCGKLPREW